MRSAFAMACGLLSGCGASPSKAPVDRVDTTVEPPDSGAPGVDTADTAAPEEPDGPAPYCRSLDPDWAAAYTSALDRQLAEVIEEQELLGDARVYVAADGTCAWRDLPSITHPLPELGRALFFSLDLSGDRDVACATCHHPELGGGDAISLSMGPGVAPERMGADRVRGLTDVADIQVGRNAPTTFNAGLWDRALFWDGRVEALDPVVGANGAGGAVVAESIDGSDVLDDDTADLVHAQAHFPVAAVHEMGGDWGAEFADSGALRDALAARLAGDADWVDRFAAVCAGSELPESWLVACASGDGEALVTFPHIARALSEYQRSQVFTQTPWAAYVQGDVDAIDDTAKAGALVFLRDVGDGGQGCARCHVGDLFSDEDFHAIGGHQIGPGLAPSGADAGRGLISDDPLDDYRFRTPSLLNVEVTAPYFHAGSMASLTQAVVFYRNIPSNLGEYFGDPDRLELHPRPWCRMVQFANIPDCDSLFTKENTLGADIEGSLDEDAADIADFEGEVSASIVAFLRTLTDPRVTDPTALAPWVAADSVLDVTDTSSEWDTYCEVMTERSPVLNLRAKGFRWVVTGAVVDGLGINADAPIADVFGLGYWSQIDPDFSVYSGLERDADVLGALTFELLHPDQRTALLAAYGAMVEDGVYEEVLGGREAVFATLADARSGAADRSAERRALLAEVGAAEGRLVVALVEAYRAARTALPESDRAAHLDALQALVDGDLSGLPEGIIDPTTGAVTPSAAVRDALAAVDTTGGPALALFAARYATFWTARPCELAFMSRLDIGARRANYFGFLPWSNRYLFDLDTGRTGPGPLMGELAGVMGQAERSLGLDATVADILTTSIVAQRAETATREDVAVTLDTLRDLTLDAAAVSAATDRVVAAQVDWSGHEADQLEAELGYYSAMAQGLAAAGNTHLAEYLACIEAPETQAMRDNGGFDALGGGTCVP